MLLVVILLVLLVVILVISSGFCSFVARVFSDLFQEWFPGD